LLERILEMAGGRLTAIHGRWRAIEEEQNAIFFVPPRWLQ
jgi:hypothetical protein